MENLDRQLQLGKDAIEDQKYTDAFRYLLLCAEADYPEAQAIIGFLYKHFSYFGMYTNIRTDLFEFNHS